LGRYDLNLSEDEFWDLTMKEFNALIIRYDNNHDWLNYRAALICSVLANIWRGKSKRIFKPADFIPGTIQGKQKPQTSKQMLATVKMLNAAFGGSVKGR